MRNAASEDGTIMLLTIGLLGVAAALIVTVVDVSAVYLDRRDLAGECDSAALSGVQSVDPSLLYTSGIGDDLPVSDVSGSAAAQAVARAVGKGTTTTARVAGGTLVVTCSRRVTVPIGSAFGLGTLTVTASSTAESPVR